MQAEDAPIQRLAKRQERNKHGQPRECPCPDHAGIGKSFRRVPLVAADEREATPQFCSQICVLGGDMHRSETTSKPGKTPAVVEVDYHCHLRMYFSCKVSMSGELLEPFHHSRITFVNRRRDSIARRILSAERYSDRRKSRIACLSLAERWLKRAITVFSSEGP